MSSSGEVFAPTGAPRTPLEMLASAGGALSAASYALLSDDSHPRYLQALDHGLALLRSGVDRRAIVLVEAERLLRPGALAEWVRQGAAWGAEVIFLGDKPVDPGLTRGLQRRWPAASLPVYRVDSLGTRHGILAMPKTPSAAARVLMAPLPSPSLEDWERVAEGRGALERSARQEQAQLQAFVEGLRGRKPVATWSIAFVLLAVFVLTWIVGGGTPLWALNRLGALDTARILDGDLFRLVSCTFLHGDVVHLAFNGVVLVALGMSFERVFGPARFLVLYGVAGLVGSAVSAWRLSGGGISVGASGAIWGMLAAEVLLVISPRSPLPAALRERARNGVMVNLVLNVMNSFRPNVDYAAHFGGGAAGFLVALFFLRGLQGSSGASLAASGRARVPAALLCALYLAGLAVAVVRAAPWHLVGAETTTVSLDLLGVRATVPAVVAAELKDVSTDAGPELTLGAIETSPVVIGLKAGRFTAPLDPATLDAEAAATVAALEADTANGPKLDATAQRVGDVVTIDAVTELPNGLYYEKCYRFDTMRWTAVESLLWPQTRQKWRGVASRVAASVESLEAR